MKNSFSLPNFYTVIPSYVRYNRALSWFDMIFYAEIVAMTNVKGYCWASNSYFEMVFNVSDRTVRRSLSVLSEANLVSIQIDQANGNQRYIYLVLDPTDKNVRTPMDKNVRPLSFSKEKDTNNIINNTVIKPAFNSFKKSQRPDIDVPWLDDYIKSQKES